MKKIMITACVAMLGVASYAASAEWMAEGIATYVAGTTIDDAKIYAFESTTLTQDAFLGLLAASDASWVTSSFLAEAYDDGAAMGTVTGYANGAATSNWLAIFDSKGNVLVSDIVTDAIGGAGQSAAPSFDLAAASSAGLFTAASGAYTSNGAGWYAVPEPTSGLLMLLGMAGLALKRKRA